MSNDEELRKKLDLEEGMGLSMLPSAESKESSTLTVECYGHTRAVAERSIWFDFPIGPFGLPRVGDQLIHSDKKWEVQRVVWGPEPQLFCKETL